MGAIKAYGFFGALNSLRNNNYQKSQLVHPHKFPRIFRKELKLRKDHRWPPNSASSP